MKKEEFILACEQEVKRNNKELSAEEKSFLGFMGSAIESIVQLETTERNAGLKKISDQLGTLEDGKTFSEIIRELATLIDSVEAKAKRKFTDAEKYNLKAKLEAKKDEITRAMKGGAPWEIEFKAKRVAGIMTNTNVMTGAAAINTDNWFDDPEIVVISYPANFVLDAISSRTVAKVPLILRVKEQQPVVGASAVVLPGGEKTLQQYTFAYTQYDRAKYAGRIEWEEEAEIDFEQLMQQIIMMFEEEVLRNWQNGVLAALVTYASSYTSSALDDLQVDPDLYGVIMAGIAWMEGNAQPYTPDVLFLNPGDLWAARGTQDKNGNYKNNPFGTGFAGLQLFSNNRIGIGKVMLGTKRTVKEQHGVFILRKGVYGDQFINNENTIIGEVYSVLQTPILSKPSWLYMDIAAIKALISI